MIYIYIFIYIYILNVMYPDMSALKLFSGLDRRISHPGELLR